MSSATSRSYGPNTTMTWGRSASICASAVSSSVAPGASSHSALTTARLRATRDPSSVATHSTLSARHIAYSQSRRLKMTYSAPAPRAMDPSANG